MPGHDYLQGRGLALRHEGDRGDRWLLTCTESDDAFFHTATLGEARILLQPLDGVECTTGFESSYALQVLTLEP